MKATKGEWPNEVPKVLWPYDTTPKSTIEKHHSRSSTDAIILIEIFESSLQITKFSPANSKEGIQTNLNIVDEVRECAKERGQSLKRCVEIKLLIKDISTCWTSYYEEFNLTRWRKKTLPKVDNTIQNMRSNRKWSLQVGNIGWRLNSDMERNNFTFFF